jgi:hypothetical protein
MGVGFFRPIEWHLGQRRRTMFYSSGAFTCWTPMMNTHAEHPQDLNQRQAAHPQPEYHSIKQSCPESLGLDTGVSGCKSLVGLLGASNWVVELAPILCVKVSCRLQGHHLVERELAFVACSPENRVSLCGVGGLCGTTPLQRRRTSRNKEGTTEIHRLVFVSPLRLLLSFTYIFTCIIITNLLVTLGKFT